MLTLGATAGTINANWNTAGYTARCFASLFDSYVSDVDFSPDGSYFAIAATGGTGKNTDGTHALCDSATRWATNATGANVQPVWADFTGSDTFWSIAVTGHRHLRRRPPALGQQHQRPQRRRRGCGAASRDRGAGPGQRHAVQLEPRPQPARRGRLRPARDEPGPVRRQRHRLHRQPQVPASEDRVLPGERWRDDPVRGHVEPAGQAVRGRSHEHRLAQRADLPHGERLHRSAPRSPCPRPWRGAPPAARSWPAATCSSA